MPNWKKLIISGSDALLNSLTVSTTGRFDDDLTISGSNSSLILKGDGNKFARLTHNASGLVIDGGVQNQYISIGSPTWNWSNGVRVYGDLQLTGSAGDTATFEGSTQSTVNLKTTTNSKNNYIVGTTSGDLSFRPDGTESVFFESGGNVGIGTSSPSVNLHIANDSGNAILRLHKNTASNFGSSQLTVGNQGKLTVSSDRFITFNTDGPERMRVDYSGNVGINSTLPLEKLHVVGNGIFEAPDTSLSYPIKIYTNNNQQPRTTGILFNTGYTDPSRGKGALVYDYITTNQWNRGDFHFLQNTAANSSVASLADSVLTIKNSGNVGIGTTSPNEKLQVSGSIHASGSGSEIITDQIFRAAQGTLRFRKATNDWDAMSMSANGKLELASGGSNDRGELVLVADYGSTPRAGVIQFQNESQGSSFLFTDTNKRLKFHTSDPGEDDSVGEKVFYNNFPDTATFAGDVTLDNATLTIDTDTAGSVLIWKESDSTTVAGQLRGYANRGDIYLYHDGVKKTEISSLTDSFIPALHIGGTSGVSSGVLEVTGDTSVTGDLTVTGTVTAQEFHTEFVSASIIYESGSTKFGDTSEDVHSFSGSLRVTGSGDHYFTDGNVGIGTSTPSGLLNINTGASGTYDAIILSRDTYGEAGVIKQAAGALEVYSQKNLVLGADEDNTYTGGSSNIIFKVDSSEYARIDSGGNLQLNSYGSGNKTGTLAYTLGVDSSGKIIEFSGGSGGGTVSSITSGADNRVAIFNGTDSLEGDANLTFDGDIFAVNTNELYVSGSRVGIGTSSPAVKLHVEGGDSYTPIRFDGFGNYQGYLYNDGGGIGLKDSSGTNIGNLLYIHTAGNNIRLYTNGSERIRFDSSGNVGIGTTSPSQKLHVVGDTKIEGVVIVNSANSSLYIGGSTTGQSSTSTGDRNVVIGPSAFRSNTSARYNTAVGHAAMQDTTTGNYNSVLGNQAMKDNIDGGYNVAVGNQTMAFTTSSSNNTAVGYRALYQAQSNSNTGIGQGAFNSLQSSTSSNSNTGIGQGVLNKITSGQRNVGVGVNAGQKYGGGNNNVVTANDSVFIGANSDAGGDNQTNQIVIGYNAIGLGSNTVVLGNNSIVTTQLKGNVGIGTTSPSQKLHVAGNARFEAGASGLGAFVSVGNTTETAGNYSAYYFGNTVHDTGYFKGGIAYETLSTTHGRGDMHFLQRSDTGSGNADISHSVMTILNTGNVGIGTTSPAYPLEVRSTSPFITTNSTGTGNSGLAMLVNAGNNGVGVIATDNGGHVTFDTGATGAAQSEKMRIDSAGNVGIGTTNPSTKLEISSTGNTAVRISTDGDAGDIPMLQLYRSSGAYGQVHYEADGGNNAGLHLTDFRNDANSHIIFNTQGDNERMRIEADGNVGIGTTSPSSKLQVVGDIDADDITINDWGSVSGSLASIQATAAAAETDTLATVTGRGSTTGELITLTRNAEQLRMNTADANGPFASFKKNGTNIGFLGSSYHLWSSPNNNSDNIGFRGENQIDFGIGASVKMTIDSSGNVGIGTTSPGKELHVAGEISGSAIQVIGGSSTNKFHSTSTGAIAEFKPSDSRSGIQPIFLYRGTVNGTANYMLASGPSTFFGVYDSGVPGDASGMVRITPNNSSEAPAVRIGDAGSNGAYLDVGGNIKLLNNGSSYINGGNVGLGTTVPQFILDVDGLSMLRTEADMWQSEQKFMRIGRFGRGTGTSDRQHYLTAKVSDSTTENFISFNIDDGSTSNGTSYATNVLKLRGDSSAIFGGNVGIGDTGPLTKLHVKVNDTAGTKSNYGKLLVEDTDAQLDLLSTSDGSWGSAINFIEAAGSSANTDVWSIARQTTGGTGDSSLHINFGTNNQHNNVNKFKLDTSGNITIPGGITVGDSNADTAQIGQKHLLGYCENTDVDTGTEDIKSLPLATYQAVFFDYVVKNGTNLRAGTVTAVHDGTNVEFTDTSTKDLGDTSAVTLSVDISGTNMRLRATTTSDNWIVKANIRGIKV